VGIYTYSTRVITVSRGIGIDYKERIWVVTYTRKWREEDYNADITETDLFIPEAFDKNGILLGRLPLKYYSNEMQIFRDRIYFIDSGRAVCVYEYKIIEK